MSLFCFLAQTRMLEGEEEKEEKASSVKETLKILLFTELRMRCLSVFFVWYLSLRLIEKRVTNQHALFRFATGLSYYAISLYSTSFSDNRFLNLCLAGVSEFPALIAAYYAVKFVGRPRAAYLLMFLCGSSCLILPFITAEGEVHQMYRQSNWCW